MRRALLLAAACSALAGAGREAAAFPPYRSTDAETADPWTLEGRLGLVRVRRDAGANAYTVPLWRVNLGLPHGLELVTEGEFSATDEKLGDAAVGLKWVPYLQSFSVGVEALALLPTSSAGGAGTEVQIVATQRLDRFLLHANGGGFYDTRPTMETEKGWRASLLGEVKLGRLRPGAELFAKQTDGGPVQPLGGAGVIVSLGPVDLRTGVHVGLTAAAPDVVASLWIASKLPLR